MFNELRLLEQSHRCIQVGLVGAGAMGRGIAQQISKVPGMQLSFIADHNRAAAEDAARVYGDRTVVETDALAALGNPSLQLDVLVEATNSILAAFDYCAAAIERHAHCVLMNAEVDLILGHLLRGMARKEGVVVTSDAGDQHGVLATLLEEIDTWGLEIVQVGNMKGFLERHRNLAGSVAIARQLKLSTEQCLAYTDGSKLNIEMSIIGNEYGLKTVQPGMRGPRAERAEDALSLFDFENGSGGDGHVDYILGARQHGAGVYIITRCRDPIQASYLHYYKVPSKGDYFLFLRPYHLCHFETPRAIARAYLYRSAVCSMRQGRVTDCYAWAKRSLRVGDTIRHAIGSDEIYGLIMNAKEADAANCVPQGLLELEDSQDVPRVKRAIGIDEFLTWDHVEMPDSRLVQLWREQQRLLALRPAIGHHNQEAPCH